MTATYDANEVQQWLQQHLPGWQLEDGQLTRTYETGSWRVTLMVANAIGFLAEAADHHPDLLITYPSVKVHLMSHDADGITGKDYELAEKIEETVGWYPTEENSLSGTDKAGWLKV